MTEIDTSTVAIERVCRGLRPVNGSNEMDDGVAIIYALAAERDALRSILQAAVDAWDVHNESGDTMQGRWVCAAREALT